MGPIVIARTCPDEQPLPMDAEARQENFRYTLCRLRTNKVELQLLKWKLNTELQVADADERLAEKKDPG